MGVRRSGAWVLAVGALLCTSMIAASAEASERGLEGDLALGKTRFGAARLSWTAPPPLHLQPERARLILLLPSAWLPQPDPGALGLGFDPNKHWIFARGSRTTRVTIGADVHLHVTDRARAVDFGLSLQPRAVVLVLRFDPSAAWR